MKKQHIIFYFFAALLALCAVSCQEDLNPITTVTLHAVIQEVKNDSKVYINDRTPYWHNGDQIRINDADYTLQTAMESTASIPNIAISTSGYRAIFPPSILTNSDANINSSSSVAVTLPTTQVFEMVGTHQRVNVPMGAVLNGGNTLQFRNLCSVVRVYVSNATNAQLPITSIILTAERACLSGAGTAIITGDSTDAIAIPSTDGSRSVSLCKTDKSTMKTVGPWANDYFDVVIPAISVRDDLTVTVSTPTGAKSITIGDAAVAHNTITTVTVNVDELTQTTAELVDGPTFNAAIPIDATEIRFEYNNVSVTSGATLSTAGSPYPIYGNMDGTIWVVSTPANRMNANADCSDMFRKTYNSSIHTFLPALTSIDFGDNFNTSNVTNMSYMFYNCNSLTNLNLSSFNTANVTDMSMMFVACNSLTSLNLSNFNTSTVTDMSDMFWGCGSLTSLDLSNFNTSNVTDMSGMFRYCNLTSLDLSNFNTANVTDMSGMFRYCKKLTSLNLSSFNTSNITSMSRMFYGCSSLTSLNLSSFNTSNVTSMYAMFDSCINLTSLNLSNFNTSNVTTMSFMFNNCSSLTSLNLSSFNTSNVTNMRWMFVNCSSLTSLNLSNFNTANVTDMSNMFANCNSLTSLNLSNFNTENVESMRGMFSGCSNLTSIDLSNFNTENVESMLGMFYGCSNLTSIDLSNFNTANVNDMRRMFQDCKRLTSLNLYNFDMSGLTSYDWGASAQTGKYSMCHNLASISGACAITCSTAVQTELQSGTDLVNSRITWYTH